MVKMQDVNNIDLKDTGIASLKQQKDAYLSFRLIEAN